MKKVSCIILLVIFLPLSGCLTQDFFTVDGVKYRSKVEALGQAAQNNTNLLAGIYPTNNPIEASALFAVNTMRRIEDTVIVYTPNKESTKRVHIDFLSEYYFNTYKAMYEALVKRGVFTRVDFVANNSPENTDIGNYDYLIYLYNPNPQSAQWFIDGRTLSQPQLVNIDGSKESYTSKTVSWLESIEKNVSGVSTSTIPPSRVDKQRLSTSFGTGFAVSKTGIVVTAYHVVDGHDNISVKFEDGEWMPAKLDRYSKSNDIAILVTGEDINYHMRLNETKDLKQADRVFTMGYPATFVLGVEPKYTEGYISSLSGLQGEDSLMQVSVPIQPGNSGGPLVDSKGRAVGLITSTAAVSTFYKITGSLPQNINWAVKSDYIKLLIDYEDYENVYAVEEPVDNTKKSICRVKAE